MLENGPGTAALVATIAVGAGVVRWWWGRTLARRADDPALPERLMETERRGTIVFVAAIAAMAFVSPLAVCWGLPLLVLAQLIAAYPLRKALFEETWSLPACVWFFVRLLVSAFGFWIVLLLMPLVVAAAGRLDSVVAALLAVALLAWHQWYCEIMRVLLHAEPIDDPALRARFTALAEASRAGTPRFELVRLQGGAIANAVALASVRRSTVLFSDTLLARLAPDEAAAICAHELAHLEHFDRVRLRRIGAVNISLIIGGASIVPLSRLAGISSAIVPNVVWLGLFLIVMMLRARDRQRNETASDLRAVELTGDAEALIRALTKLYTFARLPRRFNAQHEQHATHPSLARRIRDIRRAAGAAPSRVEGAAFAGADGRTIVTFEEERLDWREGEAATHRLSYAHLSELRLDAGHSGPTALLAVEQGGRRWRMPLAADDVARAQAALDSVDGRLPDAAAPPSATTALSRALLAVAGLLGLVAGHTAMLLLALIAALQPASPLLAAAGAGALAAAALLLRDGPFDAETTTATALLLAGFGAVLLGVAIARRREEASRQAVVLIVTLAVFTTAAVSFLALNGFDPIRLHQSTRTITSATVLLLALGGALACCRVRTLQYASIGIVLAGAGTAAAGSPAFLDRFGVDPLIAPSEPIVWRTISRPPTTTFEVHSYVTGLRLSPGGRLVALEPPHHAPAVTNLRPFQVGRPGGTLAALTASDLVFVDDERVLLMDSREGEAELRLISLQTGPTEVWRLVVANMREARLSWQPPSGRWRLLGRDHSGLIVRAEGRPGSQTVDYTHWPAPSTSLGWIDTIAAAGPTALAIETRPDRGVPHGDGVPAWIWLLRPSAIQSHVWTIGRTSRTDAAVSRFAVDCTDGVADAQLVCAAFDGTRTRFVAIDAADGRLTPIAWLDGRFIAHGSSGTGWLTGWADGAPVALRLATREAFRPARADRVSHISAMEGFLGTVSHGVGRTIVRIYSADELR